MLEPPSFPRDVNLPNFRHVLLLVELKAVIISAMHSNSALHEIVLLPGLPSQLGLDFGLESAPDLALF